MNEYKVIIYAHFEKEPECWNCPFKCCNVTEYDDYDGNITTYTRELCWWDNEEIPFKGKCNKMDMNIWGEPKYIKEKENEI